MRQLEEMGMGNINFEGVELERGENRENRENRVNEHGKNEAGEEVNGEGMREGGDGGEVEVNPMEVDGAVMFPGYQWEEWGGEGRQGF